MATTYDVFISHCGKDCKRDFAATLKRELERKGMGCFFDAEDLHLGDNAPDKMLAAMHSARFGVVILSRGFFNRAWCMKELQTFVQRGNLIPIFFEMEPDELQECAQGAAWETFSSFKFSQEEYRVVVLAAKSFTGVRLSAVDGFWDKCIGKVTSALLEKLDRLQIGGPRMHPPDTVFIGIDKHLVELRRLMGLPLVSEGETRAMSNPSPKLVLQRGEQAARVIGIEGMGGIGKTTLAKSLYDDSQVREAFEGRICWVKVKQNPSEESIREMQGQILLKLCNLDLKVQNSDSGKSMIGDKLQSAKVLLVLDDVWEDAWSRRMIDPGVLGRESCILVTMACSSDFIRVRYQLGRLDPNAAWDVFRAHAFRGSRESPGAELETKAREAAQLCKGHPHLLQIIGASIAEKVDGSHGEEGGIRWLDTTLLPGLRSHGLGDIPKVAEVLDGLRLSCVGLKEDQKTAFVLIALWRGSLENFDTHALVLRLAAAVYEDDDNPEWKAEQTLKRLTSGWLVEQSFRARGGGEVRVVDMHNLLVDLGVSFAREGRHCRRWANRKRLPDLQRDGSDWQHLVLQVGETLDFPVSFFEAETRLRSVVVQSRQLPNLFPGLAGCALLSLVKSKGGSKDGGQGQSVDLGGLTRLQSLDLIAWDSLAAVENLGQLTSLLCLGLSRCGSLKALGGLGKLCGLQRLDLSWCKALTALEDLGGLTELKCLDLRGCVSLGELTGLGGLVSLESVDLTFCRSLSELGDLSGLTKLETLDVTECCALSELRGLGELRSLRTLIARGCSSLTVLRGLHGLSRLQMLHVKGCQNLTALEGLGGLTRLQQLVVTGCKSLEALKSLVRLTALESLEVRECAQLERLEGLDRLARLQQLTVEHCRSLISLDGLDSLPALTSLNVKGCRHSSVLEVGAVSLRTVRIEGCKSLTAVRGLRELAGLTRLEVVECGALTALEGLSCLTGLRKLTLSDCRSVNALETLDSLRRLEKLTVDTCRSLTALTGLEGLRSLQSFHVEHCPSLIVLDGLERLPKLDHLVVSDCGALTVRKAEAD